MLAGLMAIGASAAQAAPPNWMVNGAELAAGLEPSVGGELEKDATLLTIINGLDIDILCTAGTLEGVKLLPGDKTNTTGDVKFTGCSIIELLLNAKKEVIGEHVLACHVHSVVGGVNTPEGTILTKPGYGLLELHEPSAGVHEAIVLIIPTEGEEFARIKTEGCVLPETIPVIGKLDLKDCETFGETEKVKHLVIENSLSELFVINKTNMEHLAKLDGSAILFLTGAHNGQTFSGLAG
jgi:hypothetical protein